MTTVNAFSIHLGGICAFGILFSRYVAVLSSEVEANLYHRSVCITALAAVRVLPSSACQSWMTHALLV